ncbi:MAG TPA: hypothetical protein VFA10_28625 [Ktedonobacteraceae bacterium]|nr:hypothetical protein [Ktedonobacteraceae bacterium]
MESQEVMMDNFVNYSHVNPLKEPNQPCECQCVAYRLKGLKWFRENVEVIFAGLLEDGRVNHYHQGSVSHAEGSHLYEFGEQRMSSVDFCLIDLSVGPCHCVDWPIFPEPSSDLSIPD